MILFSPLSLTFQNKTTVVLLNMHLALVFFTSLLAQTLAALENVGVAGLRTPRIRRISWI